MTPEQAIKLFGLNNLAIEADLKRLQTDKNFDIGKSGTSDRDDYYYPQFPISLRRRAEEMAKHYEIFYCLENSIRELIAQKLIAEHGESWWETKIPQVIRESAEKSRARESQEGVSFRANDMLAYTTFGELGEIIKANWDSFKDIFRDPKAVESVVRKLNGLRGPIAHCGILAEDEVSRLQLSLKDWFRIMS